MRSLPVLAAVCLLTATPAPAAPLPADLAAAAKAFDAAQLSQDRTALERLIAEDYLLVNGGGVTETKAQFIKDLTDPEVRQDPFTIDQPVERVWTGGAVLGGITTLQGKDHGVHFEARIRFSDVWARRDGRWQVVYTQISKPKAGD